MLCDLYQGFGFAFQGFLVLQGIGNLDEFFGMWDDLEKLLDRKVDLVTEGSLAPFAVESANRDKILIYERAA